MPRVFRLSGVLLLLAFAGSHGVAPTLDRVEARSQSRGAITDPRPGTVIATRENFPVSVSIAEYDADRKANYHYWISLAGGHNVTSATLHWPKFYVRSGQFRSDIYDGGKNVSSTTQPMTILLLRVDDGTNQAYDAWLNRGAPYSGIALQKIDVVAQIPIRFP